MRSSLIVALLLFVALPAGAQSNVFNVAGNTTGAPVAALPAFGSTSGSCGLAAQAEPFVTQLFFVDTDASYQFDVVEPFSVIPDTDDTILLVYQNSFDSEDACTNFVAIGNEAAGAGLTTTLSSDVQYVLVMAGFYGTEDAGQVSIIGPSGSTISSGELPVEMISFEAISDDTDVILRWTTASETHNAGFEIEQRSGDASFQTVGFVEGRGTTTEAQTYTSRLEALPPGRHTFRLRQIDYDGTSEYSAEVETTVMMTERFVLESAYPNPFTSTSTIRFAIQEPAPVRVALYNALGQEVQMLYDGVPDAGTMTTLRLDGSRLPSGLYLVRLTGQGMEAIQQVTLLQ